MAVLGVVSRTLWRCRYMSAPGTPRCMNEVLRTWGCRLPNGNLVVCPCSRHMLRTTLLQYHARQETTRAYHSIHDAQCLSTIISPFLILVQAMRLPALLSRRIIAIPRPSRYYYCIRKMYSVRHTIIPG